MWVNFGDASNMTADKASITYLITVVNSLGVESQYTEIQNFAKAREGVTVADGADAVAPIIIDGFWAFWNKQRGSGSLLRVIFSLVTGHSPYVDVLTGTWWEWSPELGEYKDTFIKAEGADGADGAKGQTLVPRGEYSIYATYRGTADIAEVVYYSDTSTYYYSKTTAGTFNQLPTNTTYWNVFGASFESIATGVFFANRATINNLYVKELETAASGQRLLISGSNNNMLFYNSDGDEVIKLDDDIDELFKVLSGDSASGIKFIDPSTTKGTYISSNGIINNNSKLSFTPENSTVKNNASIVGFLETLNSSSSGISSAIVGIVRAASVGTGVSTPYAGYFLGDVKATEGTMASDGYVINYPQAASFPPDSETYLITGYNIYIGENKTATRKWHLPFASDYKAGEIIPSFKFQ